MGQKASRCIEAMDEALQKLTSWTVSALHYLVGNRQHFTLKNEEFEKWSELTKGVRKRKASCDALENAFKGHRSVGNKTSTRSTTQVI